MDWQTGKPPNEKFVEVTYEGKIIEVMAMWGRDGTLPHWQDALGRCWGVTMFTRWRYKEEFVTNI